MPRAWRGVETQYLAASLALVDTADEQALLEELLEGSKPALPPEAAGKPYLLATPFRYLPAHDSRFRRAASGLGGVWYGAATLAAACAEVAWWRMRFVADSAGLSEAGARAVTSEHTFFHARIRGRAIDLTSPPWVACAAQWTHPSDYTHTHALAEAVRTRHAEIDWIRYESARSPGTACAAVFNPAALHGTGQALRASYQRWLCKATRSTASMISLDERGRAFEWAG
ncbi:RES domain-containing protein [Pseudothauera nasutitermitis]|uniref:RES domain-containing protein n=2 Tax=Pseudothauera nasutitermitis TaxID=2565930 RepID=A0A4S4B3A3_9RHOO|nr:RES domain-containing protein [Pseudothauera nasutitermitis]